MKVKGSVLKDRKKLILMIAVIAVATFATVEFILPAIFPGFSAPMFLGFSAPTLDTFMPGNPFDSMLDQNAIFTDPVNPFKYKNPFA